MAEILVIGYGNELRGDDGLGPLVAQSIAAANISGVRVMTARQLLPELAADVAEAHLVIFVDATEAGSESGVELRLVSAEESIDWSSHTGDPRTLLALTQAVYQRTPEAWWLLVSGQKFDMGEGLSSAAEENAQQALACLKRLIAEGT